MMGLLSLSLYFFNNYFYYLLAMPHGLLGSPTRISTSAVAVKASSPNYWTAREFSPLLGGPLLLASNSLGP